ncbi:hypothetical protein [Qipengyuania nanhaisediminis]|uniref:hypothetical protein n=1 Tax=Qipengyuania nanhaisediminis TaxID=604088 RepID=UPI0038B24F66
MTDPTLVIAATCLVGLIVVAFALLRGWQGWLAYKREALDRLQRGAGHGEIEGGAAVGAARIELADMKERIKKLEAIASGVEL